MFCLQELQAETEGKIKGSKGQAKENKVNQLRMLADKVMQLCGGLKSDAWLYTAGVSEQDVAEAVRLAKTAMQLVDKADVVTQDSLQKEAASCIEKSKHYLEAVGDAVEAEGKFLKALRGNKYNASVAITYEKCLEDLEQQVIKGKVELSNEVRAEVKHLRNGLAVVVGLYAVLSVIRNPSVMDQNSHTLRQNLVEAMQVFGEETKCPEEIQHQVQEILDMYPPNKKARAGACAATPVAQPQVTTHAAKRKADAADAEAKASEGHREAEAPEGAGEAEGTHAAEAKAPSGTAPPPSRGGAISLPRLRMPRRQRASGPRPRPRRPRVPRHLAAGGHSPNSLGVSRRSAMGSSLVVDERETIERGRPPRHLVSVTQC